MSTTAVESYSSGGSWQTLTAAPLWLGRKVCQIPDYLKTEFLPLIWKGLYYPRRAWRHLRYVFITAKDTSYLGWRFVGEKLPVPIDKVSVAAIRGACMIRVIEQTHALHQTLSSFELPSYSTALDRASSLQEKPSKLRLCLCIAWECQIKPLAAKMSILAVRTFSLTAQSFLWVNLVVDLYESMDLTEEGLKEARAEAWFNLRFVWLELARNGSSLAKKLREHEKFFQELLPFMDVKPGLESAAKALTTLEWTHKSLSKRYDFARKRLVRPLWDYLRSVL